MNIARKFVVVGASIALIVSVTAVPAAQATAPLKGAPQTIGGTGDGVPTFSPIDEPVIITLTHDGTSNFIVRPIGRDGKDGMGWSNEIGNYTGTTFQEMNALFSPFGKRNPIVAAEVRADGNWTIQVRKLSASPRKNLRNGSGNGDEVIRFNRATSGLTRMTLMHDGSSNFIVKPIDGKGKVGLSLVNEIGNYKGTVRVPPQTRYLWVQADGGWSYSNR